MTEFAALVLPATFFAPVLVGLFLFVLNYFDNRAAAKTLKQKSVDARQTTGSALSLSELSQADREELNAHIETLEAFAKAVRNASAAVEESARRLHKTAAQQPVKTEQHQPS